MPMRRDVRFVSGTDLSKMLTLGDVIPAIESAYLGAAQQPAGRLLGQTRGTRP